MNVYQVQIGPKNQPRLSFEAIAEDSFRCWEQHVALAEVGEFVKVKVQDDKRRHLIECGVMA